MPSNFSEGIELEMRFSPMKIVEGKCASKYCEVISAETLLDLSDAITIIGLPLLTFEFYGGPF